MNPPYFGYTGQNHGQQQQQSQQQYGQPLQQFSQPQQQYGHYQQQYVQPQQQFDQLQPQPGYATSAQFQSIEDFMKEQNALDPERAAELKAIAAARLAYSKPKKVSRKPPVDEASLAAEARAITELGETNWTGKLGEYRASHPTAPTVKGLEYFESPGTYGKFVCTVRIIEANYLFGNPNLSFTVKKQARQYASKKAIDWLISAHHMPPDGSVKWPKPKVTPPAKIIGPKIPSQEVPNNVAASPTPGKAAKTNFAGQVPELCIRLGLKMPTYKITRVSVSEPLYRGYVCFPGEVRVEGKVGELHEDVHGQKNAKERIAKELVSFLKDIERQRMEGLEENVHEEEDKKRKRDEEITDPVPAKAAKTDEASSPHHG